MLHSEIVVALVLVAGEHGDRLDERRTLLLPVLLEESLAADAVRHADHGERPIGKMRQHVRRDLRAVAQEIALGERRLLQRRIRRPVDAIEMREADPVRSTASVIAVFRACELRDDLVDRIAGGRRRMAPGMSAVRGFARRTLLGSTSSRKRRNTGRAQVIVVGPAVEAHFGDDLGLDPRRRRIELGNLGERTGASRSSGRSRAFTCAERSLVEARADMRRVAQLAARLRSFPVADEDRAERCARALALRVSADDEVRALASASPSPTTSSAGRPRSRFPCASRPRLRSRSRAPRPATRRRLPPRGRAGRAEVGQQALGEIAAAIAVGRPREIDSGEMRHVEAVEDDRRALVGGGDLAFRLQLGAILKGPERRRCRRR